MKSEWEMKIHRWGGTDGKVVWEGCISTFNIMSVTTVVTRSKRKTVCLYSRVIVLNVLLRKLKNWGRFRKSVLPTPDLWDILWRKRGKWIMWENRRHWNNITMNICTINKPIYHAFTLSVGLLGLLLKKIAKIYGLKQKCIFPDFWRLKVQDEGYRQVWFLLRPLSLVCAWLPSRCIRTCPGLFVLPLSSVSSCMS